MWPGLTTLPERVVTLLLVMVVDVAIPTVGFTTGLEAFDLGVDLGVGAFGLVDTVFGVHSSWNWVWSPMHVS